MIHQYFARTINTALRRWYISHDAGSSAWDHRWNGHCVEIKPKIRAPITNLKPIWDFYTRFGHPVNINFTNCARNHENTLHILIEVNSMSNAVLNPIDSRNPTQPNPDRQSLVDQLNPARGLCNWHRTDSKWTLNLTSPTLSWLDLSQISFFLLESDRSEAFLIPSTKLIIFGRVYLATLVQITIPKKGSPVGVF